MKVKVTREMISAAHEVTMRQGHGFYISWQTLTDIYQAMHAAANGSANQRKTSGSPSKKVDKIAVS